jgi:predicted transposase/invertase (TIGR01784 family)
MAKKLINRHDDLVKKFLTDVEAAREFLQIHVPAEIRAKCDLSSLCIDSGSYIDDDLRKRFSDVVYRLDLLDKTSCVYFYVLLEHQSTPERLMPVRILRYTLEIINKHIRDYGESEKLPLVMPLVFYNGERSPYPYPTDIRELMADQELAYKFPLGKFNLVDLTVIPNEEILQHGKLALLEMLAKHIRVRELKQEIIQLILSAIIVAHADHISKSLFDSALTYLMDAREDAELEPLLNEIVVNISEYKESVMSYAEKLRLEGEERSMQKVMSYAEKLRLEGEERSMQKVMSYAEKLRLEGEERSMQKVMSYAEKLRLEGEERSMQKVMSYAEKLRLEGCQKGRQESQQEIAKNLLMSGVDVTIVANATRLSTKEIENLRKSMY